MLGSMAAGPVVGVLFLWSDRRAARWASLPLVGGLFRWWNDARSDQTWHGSTVCLTVVGSFVGVALPPFIALPCYVWVTRSPTAPFLRLLKAYLALLLTTFLYVLLVASITAPFGE